MQSQQDDHECPQLVRSSAPKTTPPFRLDIVHRFGIADPVPLGQLLNGSRNKYLLCHLIDFAPDLTQCTSRREFTKIRVRQALHWQYISFKSLHHLSHRNLPRWSGQHMSTFWATDTFDQPLFT